MTLKGTHQGFSFFIAYSFYMSILSNQLSLPQRDDCKTRNDTMYCTTKQGQITKHPQTIVATMNNESTTTGALERSVEVTGGLN